MTPEEINAQQIKAREEAHAGLCSPAPSGSPLQFLYAVPDPCPRDIQAMSVWSQEMCRVANDCTPRELRAAWEWLKSWGESKVKEVEANPGGLGTAARKEP